MDSQPSTNVILVSGPSEGVRTFCQMSLAKYLPSVRPSHNYFFMHCLGLHCQTIHYLEHFYRRFHSVKLVGAIVQMSGECFCSGQRTSVPDSGLILSQCLAPLLPRGTRTVGIIDPQKSLGSYLNDPRSGNFEAIINPSDLKTLDTFIWSLVCQPRTNF